ncbi:tetratricopeptide repeat protein [Streptomyces sp. NBC_00286]|uniref:tetratricopeptide repeat protein n=1 Tax=Streptomyces sp. NBC_00286 TaxID=2975701 RepID=UPI002E28306A|nr:tetratricopeptide repeat protein [Streptomyces sp. NBC_00286]
MTSCPHRRFTGAPCGGAVLPTGYCAECGRAATNDPGLPQLPEKPMEFGPRELLALPEHDPRTPEERLISAEAPLRIRMTCSKAECGITFAPPYTEGPVPIEGHCPACGTPYSYRPELTRGAVLGDKYEIIGPIAHGGQGWVYLARDNNLRDWVAVKGLLNRYEEDGPKHADVERRNLVAIRHPRIVQIRDFVSHRDKSGKVTGGYIVMDDVGDRTLQAVMEETRRGEYVLDIEDVAAYGCQILEALGHLHAGGEKQFVYGDLKPSNVVHHKDGVKVIDLGGMREQGQSEPPAHVTPGYMAPESENTTTLTVAHDLHTVGVTLRELATYAVGDDVPGLGTASFHWVVERATRRDPGRRFADAQEMAGQLRGALREIRALRGKTDPPEPSAYFRPSAQLLGARLGTVPGLDHWLARPRRDRHSPPTAPALDLGAPTPTEIARYLPLPRRYPGDPQTSQFEISSGYDPGKLLSQDTERPTSVEICLHNVRVLVGRDGRDDLERAQEELDTADSIPGPRAVRDWRLQWHRGLIALRRADLYDDPRQVAEAQEHFTEVRFDLPGEYAPKLALAYCLEALSEAARAGAGVGGGAEPTARQLYESVLARNRSHGGAALGLARIALRAGDRAAALDVLGRVPVGSLDHTVAAIAALRVRAARLPAGSHLLAAPADVDAGLDELKRAGEQVPGASELRLSEDEALRLRTELYEWKLDALYARGDRLGPRRPLSAAERDVREQLEQHYRQLAVRHQDSAAAHEHLVDLSHAIRPQTLV